MRFEVEEITARRDHHAAWRLRYEHAPVVIAFLHRVFLAKNQRAVPMLALVSELEDELETPSGWCAAETPCRAPPGSISTTGCRRSVPGSADTLPTATNRWST